MPDSLDLVEQFTEKFGSDAALGRARQFMIAALERLPERLSEVVAQAVSTAKRFQVDPSLADEVVAARVTCWKYLDRHRAEISAGDAARVRAVICLLEDRPRAGVEPADLIDFFLECIEKVGGNRLNLSALLNETFSVTR